MESLEWDQMALVGRVARAHGRRGEVIVNPETDFPEERFRPEGALYLRRDNRVDLLSVTAVRFQQGRPIIKIEGVETISQAEKLAGAELRVPIGTLRRLPEGSYYQHALVGCLVRTMEGIEIGPVTRVESTQGGNLLVVEGPQGEVLVPLVAEICVEIEPAARAIVINPPAGLLELNERADKREKT